MSVSKRVFSVSRLDCWQVPFGSCPVGSFCLPDWLVCSLGSPSLVVGLALPPRLYLLLWQVLVCALLGFGVAVFGGEIELVEMVGDIVGLLIGRPT